MAGPESSWMKCEPAAVTSVRRPIWAETGLDLIEGGGKHHLGVSISDANGGAGKLSRSTP